MLTLPIKNKWFNMILSGVKKEEYRDIKPYYISRFTKVFNIHPSSFVPVGDDIKLIRFRNGYGNDRPEFVAKCSLSIKTGKEEWGAVKDKGYFTLKIHEIVKRRGC